MISHKLTSNSYRLDIQSPNTQTHDSMTQFFLHDTSVVNNKEGNIEQEEDERRRRSKYSVLYTGYKETSSYNLLPGFSPVKSLMFSKCIFNLEKSNEEGHKIIKFSNNKTRSASSNNIGNYNPNNNDAINKSKVNSSLGQKLKANFAKNKIKDLKTPTQTENIVTHKFIRTKSPITQKMNKLHHKICKFIYLCLSNGELSR